MRLQRGILLGLGAILILQACASQGFRKDPNSLYYRLGARKVVGRLVTDTVDFWAQDRRIIGETAIREKFANVDKVKLKRSLFTFFCMAANGPCTFRANMLQEAAQGLEISAVEWFYLLEGIVSTLNKHAVPLREQNEVLLIAYSLQEKIVKK